MNSVETKNPLDVLKELITTGDCRFASIVYTNKDGETSRYLLHLNVNYLKVLARDLKVLESVKCENGTEVMAKNELMASLSTSIETKGHNPAYTKEDYYEHLIHGVKYHESTLYFNAFVLQRTVLVAGAYKKVNSSAKTIAKNKFRKMLKTGKFREFRIDLNQIHAMALNGKTLIID